MSDNNEPVANVPGVQDNQASQSHSYVTANSQETTRRRNSMPWAIALATAVIAGAGGYGIATVTHDGPLDRTSIQNPMRGDGPMMGNGPMGGNGKDRAPGMDPNGGPGRGVDPDGDNWTGGGPQGMGPGMGPHCEDTNGNHAPIDANGGCPTGFTLDERGGMNGKGHMNNGPQPGPLASASPTATS